jgi:hypothetical protein
VSKGHLIFAQNSDIDYIRQAYALALSIKKFNKINEVCLITNDAVPVDYINVFDHIVKFPWGDMAEKSEWKIENRWKMVYVSPFKENLVYDSDMLLLDSNDHLWYYLEKEDLQLTNRVYDYKGNLVTCQNNPYRKVFAANLLPDVYCGLFYFKKNKNTFEFFKWLEVIMKNYKDFYELYTPKNTQKFCSMDVSSSIVSQMLGLTNNQILSFTHMKPGIQSWGINNLETWQPYVLPYLNDDLELIVGNFKQTGLFHYVEDSFLTSDIVKKLEKANGI